MLKIQADVVPGRPEQELFKLTAEPVLLSLKYFGSFRHHCFFNFLVNVDDDELLWRVFFQS